MTSTELIRDWSAATQQALRAPWEAAHADATLLDDVEEFYRRRRTDGLLGSTKFLSAWFLQDRTKADLPTLQRQALAALDVLTNDYRHWRLQLETWIPPDPTLMVMLLTYPQVFLRFEHFQLGGLLWIEAACVATPKLRAQLQVNKEIP